MTFSIANIVEEIRIVLDQNMNSSPLTDLGDVDTLSLDELIKSKIIDAAAAVLKAAPVPLLSDVASALTGTLTIAESVPHKATLSLPSDFLRLLRFKLASWQYPVHEALLASSREYINANSPYNVRGTKDRPLVFLLPGGIVNSQPVQKIEAYSAVGVGDALDNCLYVKYPSTDTPHDAAEPGNEQISLGSQLKRPTVYYAASLVAMSTGSKEAAERLLAICNESLKI